MSERAQDITRSILIVLLAVLLVVATISSYLTANSSEEAIGFVKENALAACERSNLLRGQVDRMGDNQKYFLNSAAQVRLDAAVIQRQEGEDAEARLNETVARAWQDRAASIQPVESVDCAAVTSTP